MLNLILNGNGVMSLGMGVCSQYTKSAFTNLGLESFQPRFRFGVFVLGLSFQFSFSQNLPDLLKSPWVIYCWNILHLQYGPRRPLSTKGKWTSQTFFPFKLYVQTCLFSFLAHKPRTLVFKFFFFLRQWEFVIRLLFTVICHLLCKMWENFYSNMPILFDFFILKTRA